MIYKLFLSTVLCVVASGLTISAWADSTRPYFAIISIGDTDTSYRPSSVDSIAGGDNSFELGFGYTLSSNFSISGSYHDFGEVTGLVGCPPDLVCIQAFSPENVDIDGWSVSLTGALPVADAVDVFAKLGLIAWDMSARSPAVDDTGTDLLYGAGVNWNVSDQWGIQLAIENASDHIETVKLGVVIKF